ncbi:hypothetical protein [Streptomyces phaeochromogenes]
MPRTIAEFRDWVYPEALPDTRHKVLLTRLRELHSALTPSRETAKSRSATQRKS